MITIYIPICQHKTTQLNIYSLKLSIRLLCCNTPLVHTFKSVHHSVIIMWSSRRFNFKLFRNSVHITSDRARGVSHFCRTCLVFHHIWIQTYKWYKRQPSINITASQVCMCYLLYYMHLEQLSCLPILDWFSSIGGLGFGNNVSYWLFGALVVGLLVGTSYSIEERHAV